MAKFKKKEKNANINETKDKQKDVIDNVNQDKTLPSVDVDKDSTLDNIEESQVEESQVEESEIEESEIEETKVKVEKSIIKFPASSGLQRRLSDALNILAVRTAITPKAGAASQVIIFNSIIRVLSIHSVKESNDFLNEFLNYINDNPEDFTSRRAFRYFNELIGISDKQQKSFEILLRILIDTAEPTTRKEVVKSINWSQVEDSLRDKNGSIVYERLQSFYKF